MPQDNFDLKEQSIDIEFRLEDLKKENEKLRQQLTLLEGIYDFHANQIASKARDTFTVWLRNSAIGLTVAAFLGGLGLGNLIIDYIKTESVKRSVEEIVRGNGSETIRNSIVEKAIQDLKPQIQSKVNESTQQTVTTEIANALAKADLNLRIGAEVDAVVNKVAEDLKKKNPDNEFAQIVENSVGEKLYFVVAGSSTVISDLTDERKRIKEANGGKLPSELGPVKICPPKPGKERSALVIGSRFPLDKAKEQVKIAIANNFQADTYPIRETEAFFRSDASCY